MKRSFPTRDLAKSAIFLGLAMVSFLLESLIPPPVPLIPWAKLGLSNIFVLLTLFCVGSWQAVIVLLAKCAFGGIFSGFLSLWYSLSAGTASLLLGLLLYHTCYRFFSLPGISALCAAAHNVVQVLMAVALTGSEGLLWFAPVSAAIGLVTGAVTGLCTYFALKAIRKHPKFG